MKISFTRIAGVIALLGGMLSLIGFCLLPFSEDPRAGDFRSGPGVLWDYEAILLNTPHYRVRMVPDPGLVSTCALWALFVFLALLTCFSLPPIFKQTSGRMLPLLQVALSTVAVVCLFLAVYRWTNGSSYRAYTCGEPGDVSDEFPKSHRSLESRLKWLLHSFSRPPTGRWFVFPPPCP
jgi:hypothetical protein